MIDYREAIFISVVFGHVDEVDVDVVESAVRNVLGGRAFPDPYECVSFDLWPDVFFFEKARCVAGAGVCQSMN